MKEIIYSDRAPAPVGPYSQAVKTGNLLFVSGQIALDPVSGKLVTETIEAETHQVMKNLSAIVQESGRSLENVVKCSVFVKDMKLYDRINMIYAEYFDEKTAPARELVEVANLPKFVHVEISVIVDLIN
ncbi:MAG: RidA family protein [Saprospiraceae bacterium]|nr:RidA family protein [Saprospiraceae bacterium]